MTSRRRRTWRTRATWLLRPLLRQFVAVRKFGGIAAALVTFTDAAATSSVCERAPLPTLERIIYVRNVAQLRVAVETANRDGNTEVRVADGTYVIDEPLPITGDHVMIRGGSNNRNQVRVFGAGPFGDVWSVFEVLGRHVTLAHLTAGEVRHHAVRVVGETDADDFHAHSVRLVNAGKQIFKVSHRLGAPTADRGIIEWSEIEFTAGHAPNAYTGGIGAIATHDWQITNNTVRNIRIPPHAEGHPATAIMFRRTPYGTRIENNVIVNSGTGIRLGLSDGNHGRATILNNHVHTTRDAGIALEHARDVLVAHNTLWSMSDYPNAIEHRFGDSHGHRILNNLTNSAITARDGSVASKTGNIEQARANWFIDVARGDLSLSGQALVRRTVVDKGSVLARVPVDYRCRPRRGTAPDVGAEELD